MKTYQLAFLGFGNVGKALAGLLLQKRSELIEHYRVDFCITGIATARHGAVINQQGIDLERLVALSQATNLVSYSQLSTTPFIGNSYEFIRECGADVLFENTPVNYQDGQPAVSYIEHALQAGMHVVTANKGPVVHAYRSLTDLAQQMGVKFFFESVVMDGAPIFSLFRETLPAAQLRRFEGVLNSTTNMILTRMENGASFESAVAYTQQIGIAETDPSGDIDGWDAAVKVAALVTVIMGFPMKPQQVDRQGIRHINAEMIAEAARQGRRWKLVCSAEREGLSVKGMVRPTLVDCASPMYGVEGTTSILQFETDVLGRLSIIEENPGPLTTAYGCLADFLNAVRS